MRTPGRSHGPLPFVNPASTALAAALEFHHASATLRADRIDDRRDHARVRFAWHRLDNPHCCPPPESSGNLRGYPPVFVSSIPRWLAAEIVWAALAAAASLIHALANEVPSAKRRDRCLGRGFPRRPTTHMAEQLAKVWHVTGTAGLRYGAPEASPEGNARRRFGLRVPFRVLHLAVRLHRLGW